MSKGKQSEEQGQVAVSESGDISLKRGKKRKRAAPKLEEGTLKGFAGKVTKFDDDDDDDDDNDDVGAEQAEIKSKEPEITATFAKSSNPGAKKLLNQQPEPQTTPVSAKKARHKKSRPDPRIGLNQQPVYLQTQNWREEVPPHLLKKRDALLPVRKGLPIWLQADTIRASLKKNNVLVLTGQTGSGKSTQVPNFLSSEPWCTKCIAITQPRRVAAISLARRVAEEMGSFMGTQSPSAKVGYNVRFDNATGPGTKIKFLTEGMLLQEMLRDSELSQYSAIVVDEVHERSVNVDLILGFLKNLLEQLEIGSSTRKHPFKVVIMSATADVESLVTFFEDSQALSSPAATTIDVSNHKRQISTCFVEGRQYPVKTVYLPAPSQDWIEAALKIIFQIHYKEPLPGDILVFLTGQETIEGLEKLVKDYAKGMDMEVPKVSRSLTDHDVRVITTSLTPL